MIFQNDIVGTIHARFEFVPQNLWVGAFWRTEYGQADVWLCLVPCFPLHITWYDT